MIRGARPERGAQALVGPLMGKEAPPDRVVFGRGGLPDDAAVEREGDLIVFRIQASHFIWRMVRRLAGVLVKLGKGELSMADFDELLAARCRKDLNVAAWTAPAAGLFLDGVKYGDD